MALAIVQARARSAWRVRVVFTGGNPTGQPASAFALTRLDGGPTTATVQSVVAVDVNSVELATSEALIANILYVLTWSAQAAQFQFVPTLDAGLVQPDGDDPEAEAFGVQLNWVGGNPTPAGGCPRLSGRACLTYDLPNRAMLVPGELAQAPDAGGAFGRNVNSTQSDADLATAAAKLEREFKRDPRVKGAEIDVSSTPDGEVDFRGHITEVVTGISTPVEGR